MKNLLLLATFTIIIKANAQVALTPTAKLIFKNIKTKLTNEEKNFFSNGVYIQKQDKNLLTVDENGEDQGALDVEIYSTDINKDGIEEIFTRTSGTFFGQWLQNLQLYIKDKNGKYTIQKDVGAPRFYTRAPGFGGYPDLVGGAPEGPGFNLPKGPIDMYRWDGTKYKLYKKNQANLKTDKSIEDIVSPAYVKTLPDKIPENNTAVSSQNKMPTSAAAVPVKNETVALNPMASILFSNIKTKLSDAEKNDITEKTGFTAADTMAKTKKGKPKVLYTIYPADLNNDGKEDIFLCVTTSPLGIPIKNYSFYAKDNSGKYQPMPGKIGQGIKILLNGRSGYPDLINGVAGLTREIWSWDGKGYRLMQKVAGNTNVPYQTKDIEAVSREYTSKM